MVNRMRRKNLLWTSLIILLLTSAISTVTVTFAAPAKMEVDPPSVEDIWWPDTFEVNITIFNVNDLYDWEFTLSFNPTVLEVNSVTEGPFLAEVGDDWFGTYFRKRINNAYGYVGVLSMILPDPLPPQEFPPYGADGSGVLATVEFQVVGEGVCILDLGNTVLDTITGGERDPIPHMVTDGLFDNRLYPEPPNADFSVAHPGMVMPVVEQPITFDGSASTDDGWIVSYDWDFGDSTSDSGMVVDHVFSEIGTYTVSLTVTDNDGETDTASEDVVVVPWMEGGEFPDILDAEPELYEWNEVAKGRELMLFGLVGNPTEDDFEAYVEFTIFDRESGAKLGEITTDPVTIMGGETLELSAIMNLRDTRWRIMRPHFSWGASGDPARISNNLKYEVFARCYHRPDNPDDFKEGFATIDFGFKVHGSKHDIAILDVTTNATGDVQKGDILEIYVTIDNEGGNYDEIFDITVIYKGLTMSGTVEERTVELQQQESRIETFTLDTNGLEPGPYKIKVDLTILTFEQDFFDNSGDILINIVE
jgi:PKD repeat protein